MEIVLNLNNEKREVFIEYFHAAYRRLSGGLFSPTGQAGHRSDGSYEILLNFPLSIRTGAANLTWIIVIEEDGSLNKLEVQSVELPENDWVEAATKFVSEVLAAAFSGTLTKHFYRHYFCRMGADLHGEYWLPGFRFAPAMPEDDQSYLMDAERYFYIDHEVESIDQIHGGDIAVERAILYAARLSLILDVALYKPSRGRRWFMMTDESGNFVSRREYLGFVAPASPTQMPKKGVECRLGEFGGSVLDENQNQFSLLKCPAETRKILRGLNVCAPNIKDAFDSCARLYQTSLVAGRGFPTIRLAYQVGSVEAIVQKAGGYTGFSDFVKKEAGLSDEDNEFLNYLFGSVRSAHFHGGEFPLGEYQPRKWSLGLSDPNDTSRFNFNYAASRVLRKSTMNWVVREIASKAI